MGLLIGSAPAGVGSELTRDSNAENDGGGGLSKEGKVAMEVVFPAAGLLICAIVILLWLQQRGRGTSKLRARQLLQRSSASILPTSSTKMTRDEDMLESLAPGLPPRFTYAEMSRATNGFAKKLGAGGYGAVYEGVLPAAAAGGGGSTMRVAVKVFADTHSTVCRKGFCAEVLSIGSKRHHNLVELRGFCVEDDHRMLVYDLMANGSLSGFLKPARHLQQPRTMAAMDGPADHEDADGDADHEGAVANGESAGGGSVPLSWSRRKAIAIDTATALAFLHEGDEETRIIHCDVKPANILLDENWGAKLSDFGLAKLMWAGAGGGAAEEHGHRGGPFPWAAIVSMQTGSSGGGVRGTLGYLAPEWMQEGEEDKIGVGSDVYSFGVVLLELVAGRRCMMPGLPFLPGLAFDLLAGGRDPAEILDPRLQQRGDPSVRTTVLVALWCLQHDVSLRPSMRAVVSMLRSLAPVPPPPLCTYFAGSSHFFDGDPCASPTPLPSSLSSQPYHLPTSILSGR